MMRRIAFAGALLVLGGGGLARAQQQVPSYGYWAPRLQLSVGGGLVDFAEDSARHLTTIGGTWDVRVAFMPYSPLAFEVAYVGTDNGLNNVMDAYAFGGSILGTALEGVGRLQLPYEVGSGMPLQPYIFGGVGWNHFDLVNEEFRNPAAIRSSDDSWVLPFGAGLQVYATPQLAVDARYTYRALFNEDLLHVDDRGVAGVSWQGLSQWTLSARAGYVF